MVVAMLLVAALVVAPVAAARTIDTNGTIIYVGEENLKFDTGAGIAGNFTSASITKLVHFTDQTADKTIIVSDPTNFELKKSEVGTTTGGYYLFGDTASEKGKEVGTIEVQIPSVTLDVVLNKTPAARKDSVDGKSVTRDTELIFELDTNLGGFKGVPGAPKMDIEVTLPGGGVTTQFQETDLKGIDISQSTRFYVDGATVPNKGYFNLSGAEAGTYTAIAKWPSNSDFYGKGFNSNSVTFEVLTKALAISANKDSVVRGNSFTVTITGESKEDYYLFVKKVSLPDGKTYPVIAPGQNGVVNSTAANFTDNFKVGSNKFDKVDDKTVPGEDNAQAWINTNAGGTRTIQFNTDETTDDRQFTIRVQSLTDSGTYDEVKVRVEKGEVTITASGTGVYYIGEEVTLSGTNTDGQKVYLFLTGPNLGTNGVRLDDLYFEATDSEDATFKVVDVEADDTWSYKWDTSALNKTIDDGGYTVYAVSEARNKAKLSGVKYATASIQLKPAYLTAISSGAVVAKGDDLKITGTAQGNPAEGVQIWIFGKNLQRIHESATVESDGSFEYEFEDTTNLAAGQYFMVIQHPMSNGFGVIPVGTQLQGSSPGVGVNTVELSQLKASDAASAVINALDSPNVDDTYVKLTFNVEEPYIIIDPIGDKEAGSKFTISGTTNAAVGDKMIIDVTSAAFGPSKKTEAAGFGSVSGNVVVEKGDGANKWSFEVDAANLKPDQYSVKVECIETDTSTTTNFNLVEAVETTPTTEVETTAPVGEETTTVPAGEETTEPTPAPGFGALVALAGLGAVAFLVLRRK